MIFQLLDNSSVDSLVKASKVAAEEQAPRIGITCLLTALVVTGERFTQACNIRRLHVKGVHKNGL